MLFPQVCFGRSSAKASIILTYGLYDNINAIASAMAGSKLFDRMSINDVRSPVARRTNERVL